MLADTYCTMYVTLKFVERFTCLLELRYCVTNACGKLEKHVKKA